MTHSCHIRMFTDGWIDASPRRSSAGKGFPCRPAFGFESLGYVYGPNEDRYSRDLHKLLEAIPIIGIIFTVGRMIAVWSSDCPASTKASHTIRAIIASVPGLGIILLIFDLAVTGIREIGAMGDMPF